MFYVKIGKPFIFCGNVSTCAFQCIKAYKKYFIHGCFILREILIIFSNKRGRIRYNSVLLFFDSENNAFALKVTPIARFIYHFVIWLYEHFLQFS